MDWINNKLYWTDVRERRIGVLDLLDGHSYKYNLLSTERGVSPRGIAVDPSTRYNRLNSCSCIYVRLTYFSLFCV